MEQLANADNVDCTEEEIISQVMGGPRLGYVRGMGCGVVPTSSNSSQARQFDNHEECRRKQQEMAESQERMREEIRLEIQAEMRAEMQTSEQRVQSKMEEMERLLLLHLRG
jgi:hypothetical protein